MDEKVRDAEVVAEGGESLEAKYRRVGKSIENMLKGEGLQMDVIHQVFFRPIQDVKADVSTEAPKAE